MNLFGFSRYCSGFILVALVFISTISNAQNENALLYHGNAFYWADDKIDTIREEDNETGEIVLKIIRWQAVITRMNEQLVYNDRTFKESTAPVFEYNRQDVETYFQTKMKHSYADFPGFTIQKMVINQYGKPVYFEIMFDDAMNTKALKLKWESVIEKAIVNMPRWQPGKYKNLPVLFYINPEIHITP